MALLPDDLSNLPLLFNLSQDHYYIDLCTDRRAASIADVFLEKQKSVFHFHVISFNEATKVYPYLYRAWHVLREDLLLVPFVGKIFKTGPQDPERRFFFVVFSETVLKRLLSLKDYKYCCHIGTQKAEFNHVSFKLPEGKQSSASR